MSDEPLFSGPQVGEKIANFEARVGFGDDAGKTLDVLKGVDASPVLLVFVHQVNRPSVAMTRLLVNYANTKKEDGLKSRLVFLAADSTETEAWLNRARHALPKGVVPFISTDGTEGPGAYGLNRNITLTILVAKEGEVTANFPLTQPSIQVDAPKIGHAIVKVLGGETAPTLKEMGFEGRKMNMRKSAQSPEQDGIYRRMMSPVIQKTATVEEVAAAAKAVEEMAAKTPWFRARVHRAANLIVGGAVSYTHLTLPTICSV